MKPIQIFGALFALACAVPDVQMIPTVSVGKRLDESFDSGAVYGAVGVSFVPAVPVRAYIPRREYRDPEPITGPVGPWVCPLCPRPPEPEQPSPLVAPGVAPAGEERAPWEIIGAIASAALLALMEANRRTVRVGLPDRPSEPEG
jgi:hypothetical protein